MKITFGLGLLFVCIWCSLVSPSFALNALEPITPAQYQPIVGKGFATSFFKGTGRLNEYLKHGAKIMQDVAAKGFQNLRIRCRADVANLYPSFDAFLTYLEQAVDDCLNNNIIPIISWEHHMAEAFATLEDRTNYVDWWTSVADHLKDKDYRLSFNLFTELGIDYCKNNCDESLRINTDKYNDWTRRVVNAIRGTGGNNEKRILILGSPKKEAKGLKFIDESIYKNDGYMMAEFHLYAGGPNRRIFLNDDGTFKKYSVKYWTGDGTTIGQTNVDNCLKPALQFTKETGVTTYFGAWMAQSQVWEDQYWELLNQTEVINFVRKFVDALGKENIGWSVNGLNDYYHTGRAEWKTGLNYQIDPPMDMSLVLEAMLE